MLNIGRSGEKCVSFEAAPSSRKKKWEAGNGFAGGVTGKNNKPCGTGIRGGGMAGTLRGRRGQT